MNTIISIITAVIIAFSNIFGIPSIAEFVENLVSVDIFKPSDKDVVIDTEETDDSENNFDFNVPEVKPEPVSNVKLVPAEGSTTVIDENTMTVTGLKEYIMESELREAFLAVDGDGYYEIECANPKFCGLTGTGTKIRLYDNANPENPVAVYTIVIYGDVDGDSIVTATDLSAVNDEDMFITSWSRQSSEEYDACKTKAADLNKDGAVNALDATDIGDVSAGIRRIDQVSAEVLYNW